MTDFSSFVSVEEIIIKFSFIRLIFFPNCFRYVETKAGKVLQGKNEDYFWIGFEMFFNNLVLGPQPIVRCPQSIFLVYPFCGKAKALKWVDEEWEFTIELARGRPTTVFSISWMMTDSLVFRKDKVEDFYDIGDEIGRWVI